jgi:hypothetical protein
MPLIPLNIPPGIARNGTKYQVKGRWYDANLMRWYEGVLQPIGGYEKVIATQMTGTPRGAISWRNNGGARFAAFGTNQKLYILTANALADVTPVGFTTGAADSSSSLGYGSGAYGVDYYGTARSPLGAGTTEAATWSFDTWGNDLIACCTSDGTIYEWTPPTPAALTAITNAPTLCTGVFVTAERHLVAIGPGGDQRKIQWCDQENNTVWTSTATNTAGDLTVETAGRLCCARKVRGQYLLLSDVDAFVMSYVGRPFIYGVERAGTGCGVVGQNAAISTGDFCVWMSNRGFWMYDGYVKPLPSEIDDYVFKDINTQQFVKVCTEHRAEFGEVWWFYPSNASSENDRYVVWNYRENHWTIGSLARTCGFDRGIYEYPISASPDGYIYFHEYNWLADGATRVGDVYVTSAPIEIGVGDQVLVARQLLPDEKTAGSAVEVTFATQFTPEGTERTYGPYSCAFTDGYTDVRFTGRQIAMTLTNVADEHFRIGTFRVDAVAGGRR